MFNVNKHYKSLRNIISNYLEGDESYSSSQIIQLIKAYEFSEKISFEESIELIDMLELDFDEDLDDGELSVSEKTGGIFIDDFQPAKDTSSLDYLDDFEEEEEEDSGFLTGIYDKKVDTSSLDYLDDFEDDDDDEDNSGFLGLL